MGTRADFYVGPIDNLEWIGSVGYDGYPNGFPKSIIKAKMQRTFAMAVRKELLHREDGCMPENGWPWPWEDSMTSDYAYWHDGKRTLVTWKADEYGGPEWKAFWVNIGDEYNKDAETFGACKFPNMKSVMKVNWSVGPMVLRVK